MRHFSKNSTQKSISFINELKEANQNENRLNARLYVKNVYKIWIEDNNCQTDAIARDFEKKIDRFYTSLESSQDEKAIRAFDTYRPSEQENPEAVAKAQEDRKKQLEQLEEAYHVYFFPF